MKSCKTWANFLTTRWGNTTPNKGVWSLILFKLSLEDRFSSNAGAGKNCALPNHPPNSSPILDKSCIPIYVSINLSSAGSSKCQLQIQAQNPYIYRSQEFEPYHDTWLYGQLHSPPQEKNCSCMDYERARLGGTNLRKLCHVMNNSSTLTAATVTTNISSN